MDRDGSQTLSFEDFKTALQKCRVGFEENDYHTIFVQFSSKDRSYIDIHEFLITVRGAIPPTRRELIDKIFHELDVNSEGTLSCEEIIEKFDPTQHPDVKRQLKKSNDVFREFLKAFEAGGEVENRITRNEFYNYYFNLSASIDDDSYFRDVILNTWHRPKNGNAVESAGKDAAESFHSPEKHRFDEHYNPMNGNGRSSTFNNPIYYEYDERTRERPTGREVERFVPRYNDGNGHSQYHYQNDVINRSPSRSRPTSSNYYAENYVRRGPSGPGSRSEEKYEQENSYREVVRERPVSPPASSNASYRVFPSRSPSPNQYHKRDYENSERFRDSRGGNHYENY